MSEVSFERSPSPVSEQLHARALEHLPGGNTRTTVFIAPHPPYAMRGEGAYLTDVDGRRVLDLLNNYTALIHGHAHPAIVAEATIAVQGGSCFGLPTEHEVALAERLAERLPHHPKWRFVNSGSEAVMTAIRLARAATGKSALIRFQDAYHGSYDAAMQPPAAGLPSSVESEVITLPHGDAESLRAAIADHGRRIACVLFDALPSRAGAQVADPSFVAALREETRRNDIVLIHDEVISFRLAHGGLQSLYDLEPDLTTVGKIIGGGFPIGAVGGRSALMDLFDPRRSDRVSHPGTFNANPVSMRAGVVSLDLLTADEIERINALGDRLRAGLVAQGWDVRGHGSLMLVTAPDPVASWWALYEAGILLGAQGLACTSTAMDDADVDRALEAFDRVRRG